MGNADELGPQLSLEPNYKWDAIVSLTTERLEECDKKHDVDAPRLTDTECRKAIFGFSRRARSRGEAVSDTLRFFQTCGLDQAAFYV